MGFCVFGCFFVFGGRNCICVFAWSGLLIALAADEFIMDIPVGKNIPCGSDQHLNAFSGPSNLLTIPPEVFMRQNWYTGVPPTL